ncbi:MAG: hypothetical protein AB7S26_01095 [Sandaracinaceae bacterium]
MSFRRALIVLLSFGLIACDGDGSETDAGADDAAAVDAGVSYVCERTEVLEGELDTAVSTTFDTSMESLAPRDLGLDCGNPDAELRWAPQHVIEYHVPGTDPVMIDFTTINDTTTPTMVVVVQARVNECTVPPGGRFPPLCFGPASPNTDPAEWRSNGQLVANGGDTVYFFVTGYSEVPDMGMMLVDRGTVKIDITARLNSPPTLDSASVILAGNDVRVEASGNDPNANARGAVLRFYTAAGELIDIYGDGRATPEGSVFPARFDAPVSTGFDFTGGVWIRSTPNDGATQLGEYLVAQDIRRASVQVFDAPNGVSAEMMVDIQTATFVGYNEACDAAMLCRPEMECSMTSMTCQPTMAVGTACQTAEDIALPAFSDTAVTVNLMANTRVGAGQFEPGADCGVPSANAAGAEHIYAFDAPAAFDLLVTTDLPGTGATDTILYVRNVCFDRGAELGCSDDIMPPGNVHSSLEIRDLAAGGYYVFVEEFIQDPQPGTGDHEIQITARPILGTGATCDMAEVDNRCMAGPCAAGVCP